jgi:hypothetical protein
VKIFILVSIILFTLSVNLLADDLDFLLLEPAIVDAQGASLGRTTVLTTSGSNALFTNPACLAMLEEKVIQGGFRALMGSGSREYDAEQKDDEWTYPVHVKFNHLSFAMPYQIQGSSMKTVFAIGYRNYFDLGYNYIYKHKSEYNDYEYTYHGHGGLNHLSFGGGLNFQDKFYTGVSYSLLVMSKFTWEEEATQDGITEKDDGECTITKGSFFTLGGVYKASPKLELGFYYRMGFVYERKVDYLLEFDYPGLLAASASYCLSDAVKIIFEYQDRRYQDFKIEGHEWLGDIPNGLSLNLGAELGKNFRIGYYRLSVPLQDYGNDSKLNTMNGFTAGTGFALSPQLNLDIYGEYAIAGYEDVEDTTSFSIFKTGASFTYTLK